MCNSVYLCKFLFFETSVTAVNTKDVRISNDESYLKIRLYGRHLN